MGLSATARFTPRGDLGRFVEVHVTPAVTASVDAAAKLITDTAKGYCPVDTGALRESITYEVEQLDTTVQGHVSVGEPYGVYVEYGTGVRGEQSAGAGAGPYNPNWPGMAAQPFIRPALDESKEAIKEMFRSNISSALG